MNLINAIYEFQTKIADLCSEYSEHIPATVMCDKLKNVEAVLLQQAEIQLQQAQQEEEKPKAESEVKKNVRQKNL